MSATVLPLGSGTLTHNAAGVPIIVACTKADLIDENTDVLGPGASSMGAMVKGKGVNGKNGQIVLCKFSAQYA